MAERQASVDRPVSGIPISTNKRSSMSLNSVLQNSSNSLNGASSSSRSSTPVTIGPVPENKKSPRHGRRQSLLSGAASSGAKKTSPKEKSDDPAHLKAQIALLQSSLYASHQRIMEMTADMNLNTSMSSPTASTSNRPWTPINGVDMTMSEAFTPMTDLSRLAEDDGDESELEPNGESSRSGGMKKSKSNFDLHGNALTPGKDGLPQIRKTSDGPGISRIPRASVAHARLLHDASPGTSPIDGIRHGSLASPNNSHLQSPFASVLESPYSPAQSSNGRLSPNPGLKRSPGISSAASTRVIDGLQTDLINTKGHVEKLKQEMRSNSRLIGSLTRQTEDLKETKERMRVECEGLNNVISRKERLLQEVLERARAAEASLADHLSTKKAMEESTKRSLNEMVAQLKDAQNSRAKADSEAASLRDGVKSLRSGWAREVQAIRDEMRSVEEQSSKTRDEASQKHHALVKLIKAQTDERTNILNLAADAARQTEAAGMKFETQIAEMRIELERTARENRESKNTVTELVTELTRLRRLMREPKRSSLEHAMINNDNDNNDHKEDEMT